MPQPLEAALSEADEVTLRDNFPNLQMLGSHFYNGAGRDYTGATLRRIHISIGAGGGKSRGTAKDNILKQTSLVRSFFNPDSCASLGLALHYLTDLTQPMHTSSYSGVEPPPDLHAQYENYVPVIQEKFRAAGWDHRFLDGATLEMMVPQYRG